MSVSANEKNDGECHRGPIRFSLWGAYDTLIRLPFKSGETSVRLYGGWRVVKSTRAVEVLATSKCRSAWVEMTRRGAWLVRSQIAPANFPTVVGFPAGFPLRGGQPVALQGPPDGGIPSTRKPCKETPQAHPSGLWPIPSAPLMNRRATTTNPRCIKHSARVSSRQSAAGRPGLPYPAPARGWLEGGLARRS